MRGEEFWPDEVLNVKCQNVFWEAFGAHSRSNLETVESVFFPVTQRTRQTIVFSADSPRGGSSKVLPCQS